MDDTALHLALGIHGGNGFHEAFQLLVFDSGIRCSLTFLVIQFRFRLALHYLLEYIPEHLFHYVHGDAQDYIGRFDLALMILFHLVNDKTKIYTDFSTNTW